MARTKKPQAPTAEPALDEAGRALAERIAVCEADLASARADLERLRGAQDQALRDGPGRREEAKRLVGDILAAERTVQLLERERSLLADEERTLRARRVAEEHLALEREVAEQIKRVGAAAQGVDEVLDALGTVLAAFAKELERLFSLAADISPPPAAVDYLGRWVWWDSVAERVGRIVFEARGGRGVTVLPLGRDGQRFSGLVANTEHIVAGVTRDMRRPEALAKRYEEPGLAEAVGRALEQQGGEA